MLGEGHVVRQPRPGQVDRHVVHQPVARVDHAVVQVGRGGGVVEEQQLAGVVVDLGVRGDARLVRERPAPGALAQVVQGQRVEQVQVAALPEAGHRDPGVHDHVGRRGVLHPAAGAPAVRAGRDVRVLGDPGPQRAAGFLLGQQPVGADEPVPVGHLPVPERDLVDHPVAVEGVIPDDGRMQRVLGVAQVHAVQIVGQVALDVAGRPRRTRCSAAATDPTGTGGRRHRARSRASCRRPRRQP